MIVGTLFAAAALTAGCESLQPKLDMRAISAAVASTAKNEFERARIGDTRCPRPRVQKRGDEFRCGVVVDAQVVSYTITQTDGHGRVSIKREGVFAFAETVADQGRAKLREQGITVSAFTCNDLNVYFPDQMSSVRCLATLPGTVLDPISGLRVKPRPVTYYAILGPDGKVAKVSTVAEDQK